MAADAVFRRCAQDAAPCGPHIVSQLDALIHCYFHSLPCNTTHRCSLLIKYANEAIATYPYAEVPDHWRRLYMDATLLLVALSLRSQDSVKEEGLLDLVKKLDTANIVTAYFAEGRREAFFELLGKVQQRISTTLVQEEQPERPNKKRRLHEHVSSNSPDPDYPLLPHITQIKRYTPETAPCFEELQSFSSTPFMITGGISHWPALSDPSTNWKDAAYLLKVAGRGRIVPVEIGKSYTAQGWTQKMVPFEEFLDKIHWSPSTQPQQQEEEPPMYLAQHDLFQQFPSLLQDIVPPDYVFSDLLPPDHFKEYRPPNTDAGYTINAWMGPKGTYSPAHTDPYYNCYAQVVGVKYIWVAPPECSDLLLKSASSSSSNTHTEDSTPSYDDNEDDEDNENNPAAQQFMDNTTTIDVFEMAREYAQMHDSGTTMRKKKDDDKTGGSNELLMQKAMQAILQEGDLLFMPPKWWHAIKSLERSFSVSMWF